jgi:hypothetical protein
MSKNWYDRGYVVQENTGPCNSFKDLKHTWMTQPDSINAEPISVCFVNHYFLFLSMIMINQGTFMPFSIKMSSSFCFQIHICIRKHLVMISFPLQQGTRGDKNQIFCTLGWFWVGWQYWQKLQLLDELNKDKNS